MKWFRALASRVGSRLRMVLAPRIAIGRLSAPVQQLSDDNLAPGIIDPDSSGPWRICMEPSSEREHWTGQIERDTHRTHHRRPPPQQRCADQMVSGASVRIGQSRPASARLGRTSVAPGAAVRHALYSLWAILGQLRSSPASHRATCRGAWRATSRRCWGNLILLA